MFFDAPLSGIVWLQPELTADRLIEVLQNLRMSVRDLFFKSSAELLLEVGATNVGVNQAFEVPEAMRGKLLLRERQCRVEMAKKTGELRRGNLPDAEEAQDVVDPVGIEVLCHADKSLPPPGIVVQGHLQY